VPRPGGTCSGYLLEEAGTRILLDCGTGVYSRLQHHLHPFDLDAIFISHMHADHFFDLVPFRYALIYTLKRPRSEPLSLWLPPGATATLESFARSFGAPPDFFGGVFAMREYEHGQSISIGGLTVEVVRMEHFIPSFGMRVGGNGVLAYSADTSMCTAAVEVAKGADLFLCEATAQESTYDQTRTGHLSAADAGRAATAADVPFLLLTHIWHELDPRVSLEEAREQFGGRLEVAVEGKVYEVKPGSTDDE
jgi:ribonuclease BN (tRNA processing enzyme)